MTGFYRLTAEEWVQVVHALTESQKDVLYYLRTLSPFGDKDMELGVREIARALDYNPGTVSRALTVLRDKGYINLEILKVRVKINSQVLCPDNSVAPEQQCCPETTVLHPDNQHRATTTTTAPEQQPRRYNNNRRLKRKHSKGSSTPKTLKTLKTNQTLSLEEQEREEALVQFVMNRLKNQEGIDNLRAYALGCLQNDRAHWEGQYTAAMEQQAYLHQQRQLAEAQCSAAAAPVEKVENPQPPDQPPDKQGYYQVLYQNPKMRSRVVAELAAHPEYGLVICDGQVVRQEVAP